MRGEGGSCLWRLWGAWVRRYSTHIGGVYSDGKGLLFWDLESVSLLRIERDIRDTISLEYGTGMGYCSGDLCRFESIMTTEVMRIYTVQCNKSL